MVTTQNPWVHTGILLLSGILSGEGGSFSVLHFELFMVDTKDTILISKRYEVIYPE